MSSPFGREWDQCLANAILDVNGDENRIEGAVMKATQHVRPVDARKKMRRNFPSIIWNGILKKKHADETEAAQKQIANLIQESEAEWPFENRKKTVLEASGYSDRRHYKKSPPNGG